MKQQGSTISTTYNTGSVNTGAIFTTLAVFYSSEDPVTRPCYTFHTVPMTGHIARAQYQSWDIAEHVKHVKNVKHVKHVKRVKHVTCI